MNFSDELISSRVEVIVLVEWEKNRTAKKMKKLDCNSKVFRESF